MNINEIKCMSTQDSDYSMTSMNFLCLTKFKSLDFESIKNKNEITTHNHTQGDR